MELFEERRELGVVGLPGDRPHGLRLRGFALDVEPDAAEERIESRESSGECALGECDAAFAVGRELIDAREDPCGGVRSEALA